MGFLKEWWTFLGYLFTRKIDQDMVEAKMSHILTKGYAAMMWCGVLISRPIYTVTRKTWNHEGIHLQQARKKGSWPKFYLSYLGEYLWNLLFLWLGFSGAYYCISYEMQAYGNESDYKYTVTDENMKLYKIKNKRKVWKENKKTWKTYCRSIEK